MLVSGCGSEGVVGESADAAGAQESSPAVPADAPSDAASPDVPADVSPDVSADVAAMRAATAQYADDVDAAVADGHFMITRHMPDQGYHFLNPDAPEEFDPAEPQILMYARDGDDWELVAFEWVWPEEPEEPPMDGATYGSFPAACHYEDGRFAEAAAEGECAEQHPDTGAEFTFWHPDLVTLHVWAWLHNPEGLYNPTNPLMSPYNGDSAGGTSQQHGRNVPV
ncbi:MAG: hypothetical protein ACODAF_02960 [Actinomycetota bacterium]